MKTIINKLRYTLLLGFIALAAAPVNALTLDVCNGSQTNAYIPLDAYNLDYYNQVSQMIYPNTMLTNMRDSHITKLTFYADNNITLTSGSFTIKMGTTTNSNYSSATRITANMTTVATGNIANCITGNQFVITLNTPFEYNGNSLVIDVQFSKAGQGIWQTLSFMGASQSNASIYGENSNNTPTSFTRQSFLPRVQFTYEANGPTISASPSQLTYSVSPNATQNQTVNVTGQNLTSNITATLNDANGVFSINSGTNPVNLGNGGSLSITYSPTAIGTHSATVTLSSSGADPVTITLNGICEQNTIVCDNTNTNANLPVYGTWFDSSTGQHNQILYPEGKISDDLNGKKITKITFYPSDGINFYKNTNGGTVTIKLGNMPRNTTGYASNNNSPKSPNDGFVTVKTIELDTEKHPEYREWVFENLDDDFIYNGGDLLIDVTTTQGGYGSTNFLGETQSSYTGYISYTSYNNTVNSGQQFLPKVKFDWEDSAPITDGTVSPSSIDFGAKNIGGTYTATVTVTNTGNQPFTPTITTNLPQGITVSPTTIGQMNGGSTQNLTVTFTPTAEQSYSGSFTVTIPVPDDDDIVVTVTVTGSGYYGNRLTSNTTDEIPVHKSEAQADGTYIFSQDDVDGDTDMSLSYGTSGINVEVLVKNEEPVVRYDLHKKEGDNGTWTYPNGTAVATATQDSSNPKSYTVGQETFTIPSDATEMWVPMAATGVDASTTYFVPVTYANGIVTTGNTYGAPQVTATTVNLEPTLSIGGSKSAGRPGGHWDQTVNGSDVDYCVYTPVISISPVYPEGAVPYLVRAWLLENEDIPFFAVTRVANANDPDNTHIEGGAELTYPHPLGEMELTSEMIGGTLTIGYDWNENNAGEAGSVIQPNAFAAPSAMSQGEITIAVRVYYYKSDATQSGQKALRDGSEAPADGYGYGEGNGSDEGIPTAVSNIYTDRQVVDVKYVNTIGMQSDKPFDGVNIVVTRYSDGSITTTKVLK